MKKILFLLFVLVFLAGSLFATGNVGARVSYEEFGIIAYTGEYVSIAGPSLGIEWEHYGDDNQGFGYSLSYVVPLKANISDLGSIKFDLTEVKKLTKEAAILSESISYLSKTPTSFGNYVSGIGLSALSLVSLTEPGIVSLINLDSKVEYNFNLNKNTLFKAGVDIGLPLVGGGYQGSDFSVAPAILAILVGVPLYARPYIGISYQY